MERYENGIRNGTVRYGTVRNGTVLNDTVRRDSALTVVDVGKDPSCTLRPLVAPNQSKPIQTETQPWKQMKLPYFQLAANEKKLQK